MYSPPPALLDLLGARFPGLQAVYLFGSAASDALRPDSDIDLAILAGPPVMRADLLEAQVAAANLCGRDVDLVDLAAASTVLARQVIVEGRRLAAPNAFAADLFEIRTFRDYEDLKRRRAEIEADIVARGRVHG